MRKLAHWNESFDNHNEKDTQKCRLFSRLRRGFIFDCKERVIEFDSL